MIYLKDMYITGTQVNYYFVCKTKLWLFSKNITFENESELVALGSLLHEFSYNNSKKEIILGSIGIDYIKKKNNILEIHEIKKSNKMEKADYYQLLYYLYYLKRLGIKSVGIINYPNSRKIIKVELTKDKEKEIKEILEDIKKIITGEFPKPIKKPYCKKCAYYEFCWC